MKFDNREYNKRGCHIQLFCFGLVKAFRYSWSWTVVILLAGCFQGETVAPALSTATTPPSSSVWELLLPGLERRVIDTGLSGQRFVVLRIDPAQHHFRAHYLPAQTGRAEDWMTLLPEAVAIVNANFFGVDGRILGLLVADGVVHGASYTDRGGTFLVRDGQPRILSNLVDRIDVDGAEQAVQAFPMLVYQGEAAFTREIADRATRRTVIGQDREGRVILLATPFIGPPLRELSLWLAETDLDLWAAFNLDGGGSTLMARRDRNGITYEVLSFDAVPAILAVYPREVVTGSD